MPGGCRAPSVRRVVGVHCRQLNDVTPNTVVVVQFTVTAVVPYQDVPMRWLRTCVVIRFWLSQFRPSKFPNVPYATT